MRFGKLMLAAALTGTVVAGSVPAVALAQGENAQLQAQDLIKGDWVQTGGRWWFATEGGGYLQGAWKVDDVPYIFDANGWLITDRWSKLSDGRWYLSLPNGVVAQGWRNLNGVWYYFEPWNDGAMSVDWTAIDGAWYYFGTSGAMHTGWQQLGGTWYYLGSGGAMCTGWRQLGGTWYYFGSTGAMYENRWLKSGEYWYYFGPGGAMVTGWQQINGEVYCFSESDSNKTPMGGMFTGLVQVSETSQCYYFYEDGTMARDVWIDTGTDGTIYFGSDGIGTLG